MSMKIPVYNGKYTFVKPDDDYRVHVLRYGEEWLTIESGSNAIVALLGEYEELKEKVKRLEGLVDTIVDYIPIHVLERLVKNE